MKFTTTPLILVIFFLMQGCSIGMDQKLREAVADLSDEVGYSSKVAADYQRAPAMPNHGDVKNLYGDAQTATQRFIDEIESNIPLLPLFCHVEYAKVATEFKMAEEAHQKFQSSAGGQKLNAFDLASVLGYVELAKLLYKWWDDEHKKAKEEFISRLAPLRMRDWDDILKGPVVPSEFEDELNEAVLEAEREKGLR